MKILVTGGSGGIGSAIKNQLISEGHEVVAPTSSELDLADLDAVELWISNNSNLYIGGLVLSAGINSPKAFLEISDSDFARTFDVNMKSSRMLIQAFLPTMVKHKVGRIVAVSSAYANLARIDRSSYSISKAALEALIRSIAVEHANTNIIANVVVPGFISTPLTQKNNSQTQIHKLLERIPIGRLGTPLEVAQLVSFLLSEKNTYITGQSIAIDGGFSIN